MLKKLKVKFVAAIMTIVTVFFVMIFAAVIVLTKQNMERESIQMMRGMTFAPMSRMEVAPPEGAPEKLMLPFFTIERKSGGEIFAQGSDYYDLTDTKKLTELAELVSEKSSTVGVIPEYNLRYMKNSHGSTQRIVFADISSEKVMLRGLVRNLLIIGSVAYVIFFIISLQLAKWVTKPVEKTWNEQKQFIADASHELKTPLTVIMTNAEMLTDRSYTETERDGFTKNILSTSKRMRGLVESLLQLARLDNNRAPLKNEALDLSRLVNDSLLPFEPLFYENGLCLSSEISEGVNAEGDKDKLRQVVNILLDNALKYSERGSSVSVRLKTQSCHCILSVTSKGTNLTEADCKNIFRRFYRVDESRNDGHSYGLGLPIAEGIITEHHGRIWAESKNGYNVFYVSLPTKQN